MQQEHYNPYQERYAKRLEEEKKIKIFYIPFTLGDGSQYYAYIAVSALLEKQFIEAIEYNQIPDYSVVIARGPGNPPQDLKDRMKQFYGFDHEEYLNQVSEQLLIPRESLN